MKRWTAALAEVVEGAPVGAMLGGLRRGGLRGKGGELLHAQ